MFADITIRERPALPSKRSKLKGLKGLSPTTAFWSFFAASSRRRSWSPTSRYTGSTFSSRRLSSSE
jgi:hypothetical protein